MLKSLFVGGGVAVAALSLLAMPAVAADTVPLKREAWACKTTADWDELTPYGVNRDQEGWVLKLKELVMRGRCRHFDQGSKALVIERSLWRGQATLRMPGSAQLWVFQSDVVE